ncbi:MAG: aminodeoxychorismate synthase component I [Prevotella sp.]|nr:aminodeoxychorismate synthase component I [Prevotella sp.]
MSMKCQVYGKQEAIAEMNKLAKAGKEFVFIVSYNCEQTYISEVNNLNPNELLVAFPTFQNIEKECKVEEKTVKWSFVPPCRTKYEQAISYVKNRMRAGDSYLANLTCKVNIDTNLDLRDIFLRSKALYRCWLKDRFVCFSPEIFVRIDKGRISSYPMKGTIDATIDNAEISLLGNEKEAAEHATIVDLIRNDLSMVATQVQVTKYRYIDRLTTNQGEILQTSSEIQGRLTPYYQDHIGDLLFKLLPAGSITGAPKPITMDIIAEAEKYNRGFYTGVMGHYAHGCLDSAVMIRFIDCEDGQLYYKAGGGITAKSNNGDEYQEVKNKIYVPIY